MSEILQSKETVKLYEYEPYKPDLEDYIQHFNHNHDPRNGQFTTGPGGPISGGSGDIKTKKKKKGIIQKIHDHKVKKKRIESLEKARKTKSANIEKRKTEAAEQEKIKNMREEAIKKNDILTMYKNADHFTNAEIETALNRKGTLDRLAAEAARSAPVQNQSKFKSGVKTYIKDPAKKGLASGTKKMVSNLAENALKMGLTELAVRAAGGEATSFSKLSPKEKKSVVLRLFRENK